MSHSPVKIHEKKFRNTPHHSPAHPFRTLQIDDVRDLEPDDIKNLQEASRWASCCSDRGTDSRLLKFISLYLIILFLLGFCILQLFLSASCEDTTAYLSLLTLLIGVILPQPRAG